MKIIQTKLEGVVIIEPSVFSDQRGYFMELYQYERYREIGINYNFVQDNLSYSIQNTLRGLHYQHPHPQIKLVNVIRRFAGSEMACLGRLESWEAKRL